MKFINSIFYCDNLEVDFSKQYKGVFITGTDTDIGKTKTAYCIGSLLKKNNINFGVMKPISTGGRQDAIFLKRELKLKDSLNDINPIYFKRPLAPYIAAVLGNKEIDIKRIMYAYNKLRRKYDFLIIEGAGGILVPIHKNKYMLDLAKMMKLPVIIVSRPGLGAINHTLLTAYFIKKSGMRILGFIINYTKKYKTGLAEKLNPAIISELGGIKYLGTIPYIK